MVAQGAAESGEDHGLTTGLECVVKTRRGVRLRALFG